MTRQVTSSGQRRPNSSAKAIPAGEHDDRDDIHDADQGVSFLPGGAISELLPDTKIVILMTSTSTSSRRCRPVPSASCSRTCRPANSSMRSDQWCAADRLAQAGVGVGDSGVAARLTSLPTEASVACRARRARPRLRPARRHRRAGLRPAGRSPDPSSGTAQRAADRPPSDAPPPLSATRPPRPNRPHHQLNDDGAGDGAGCGEDMLTPSRVGVRKLRAMLASAGANSESVDERHARTRG
jgi:hypothetical protein